jgi:ATP-binding cassette subfamily F protein uup
MYRTLKEEARRGAPQAAKPLAPNDSVASAAKAVPSRKPGRLSYKDQRELDGMETAIEQAESRKADLEAALASPETYTQRAAEVPALQAELANVSAEVDRLYARWQELQTLVGA